MNTKYLKINAVYFIYVYVKLKFIFNICFIQDSWKEEIRQKMETMTSRNTMSPRVEEELIQKRQEELKHARVCYFLFLITCYHC